MMVRFLRYRDGNICELLYMSDYEIYMMQDRGTPVETVQWTSLSRFRGMIRIISCGSGGLH